MIKKLWENIRLALLFAATVFCIMVLTISTLFTVIFILSHFGINPKSISLYLFAFAVLGVGTLLSIVFSRIPLKPLQDIMNATDKIADGDYSVRLNLKITEEFKQLSRKFNHMAEELGSVEMLRNDFINSFSHEFKTPIVSICGFAKMLKLEDLSVEERNEYLDIIIDEAQRLSELSTNVLNLSKVEQQSILTDKKNFNISEQIRLVIAMMENKWSKKKISFAFDCEEVFITGNEEMLKQVWINLIDNAIKFSPENGIVKIKFIPSTEDYSFAISNQAERMSDEDALHIFDKFYQADKSHTLGGNGLGLTIAKKIIELHKGGIAVKNFKEDEITFLVNLPKN